MKCECGCGQTTAIIKKTITAKGRVAGEHSRFVIGHNTRLRPRGEEHPCFRQDAGYSAIHFWMERNYPKDGICEWCGEGAKRTDYASIGHTYTRSRDDWLELCLPCHRKLDRKEAGSP